MTAQNSVELDPLMFSSPPSFTDGTPDNEECLNLISLEAVVSIANNLVSWSSTPCLDTTTSQRKLKAAALIYDVEHILQTKPRITWGPDDLPSPLQTAGQFTKCLTSVARIILAKASQIAGPVSTALQYGPYQGGAQALHASNSSPPCLLRVASLNLRGGLGARGRGTAKLQRIAALAAQLKAERVHVAVLSEPRFAPGAAWPSDTGYIFWGHRSCKPDTVALLVAEDVLPRCRQLDHIGSPRHMWLQVQVTEQCRYVLILCAYGPHKLVPNSERLDFWVAISRELADLRKEPCWQQCPVILAGDLNCHFPFFPKNVRYAGSLEQRIADLLSQHHGFRFLGDPSASSHKSGTSLNVMAASPYLEADVYIQPSAQQSFPSDHLHVFACFNLRISSSRAPVICGVTWARNADWDEALEPFHFAFMFIAAWSTLLSRSLALRQAVVDGAKKRLRANLVTLVAWWRALLLALAGHVGGLAQLQFPSKGRAISLQPPIQAWVPDVLHKSDLELRFSEECHLIDVLRRKQHQVTQRHARLWTQGRSQADAFVSGLISSREPISFAFLDQSGNPVPTHQCLQLVTDDFLQRAQGTEKGDSELNSLITQQVAQIRKDVLREVDGLQDDPFSIVEVQAALIKLRVGSTAVGFPRKACKSRGQDPLFLTHWALVNAIAALAAQPETWFREVCPIRKHGHGPVHDPKVLRPITTVDVVESLLDGLWFAQVRCKLEAFMSMQQTGGRYEHFMLVLGMVLVLQSRMFHRMRSFLQVADIERGFESVPRILIRWLLRQAGVEGWNWLTADIALGSEHVRVRVGQLIGTLATLEHNSIGQGKQSGVHLFGLYTKTLISAVNQAFQGVPMFPPLPDLYAQPVFHFPFQMYVDDAIVITEGETDLQLVNAELTKASSLWRCKFAGGKKGPRVLPLMPTHGPPTLTAFDGGKLCGHVPTCVDQITLLGILIDDELSFEPLLSKAVAEMQAIGLQLAAGMSSHGFGIPAMASQFHSRVLGKALHGCELLASCRSGWGHVAKRLNDAQYFVAKAFLCCPHTAHLGSQVAALAETRLLTRASTWLAKSIVMARARLACLPLDHSARLAGITICQTGIPDTWMSSSLKILKKVLQVEYDLWDDLGAIPPEVLFQEKSRKQFLSKYCRQYVLPKIKSLEHSWFGEQLAKLNSDGLVPYADLAPLRHCWTAREQWTLWPTSLWHMHRIWCVARIIGGTPILSDKTSDFVTLFAECPLCQCRMVGLLHFVSICPATQDLRPFHSMTPMNFLRRNLEQACTEAEAVDRIVRVASAVCRAGTALRLRTV